MKEEKRKKEVEEVEEKDNKDVEDKTALSVYVQEEEAEVDVDDKMEQIDHD